MWLSKAPINTQKQWSIATLLAINLTGCASLGWSNAGGGIQLVDAIDTSTIAALKQAPQLNAIVQIKGQVGSRVPLLGKTAYELRDATGSIWVLSTNDIPSAGDEVVLKGKLLYQSVSVNGKEQGAIYLEQQQLQRTSALKSDRGSQQDAT